MKKLVLSITALCVCTITMAQTLSPTVVASSGGYFTSANGSISTTVGEMTMVQTFSSAGNILTQGFQQPEDLSVSITENFTASGEVLIYPNPTNGQFTLSFVSDKETENNFELYNLVGQVILTKLIPITKGLNTIKFDLSNYSQGIYLLGLNNSGKLSYYKINVIY